MSGLAGLWNLDGRPVDGAIPMAMAAAIEHRGTDHAGVWSGGDICFLCQLLRVAPESIAECQPVTDGAGNAVLFDGRLDNRNELLSRLTSTGVARDAPDSELVLNAWQKWGEGFVGRLKGDFALAVFDSRLRTLLLMLPCRMVPDTGAGATCSNSCFHPTRAASRRVR